MADLVRCTVEMAGPAEDRRIYIFLRATDNSFYDYFCALPAMQKEMLATALTAISLNKQVDASLTGFTANQTIERLYVIR